MKGLIFMALFKNIVKIFSGFVIGISLVFLFNFLVDPFGVFGDAILNWYEYNITMNPHVGKISYLDRNYEKYDSYVFGSSKTGVLSTEQLNKYFPNSNFYNLFNYGIEPNNLEETVTYVIDNYNPKNLFINLSISELQDYEPDTDLKKRYHGKTYNNGKDVPVFYFDYLKLNPSYSFDKLKRYFSLKLNKEDIKTTETFFAGNGLFNKIERDSEVHPINISDYLKEVEFSDYRGLMYSNRENVTNTLNIIRNIKNKCTENNINLVIISSPTYEVEIYRYDLEMVLDYWIKLSEITEFWNFSGFNSLSNDPRLFYDDVHFRTSVGEMMLGKVFDDKNIYVPDGFGVYFTKENSKTEGGKLLTPREDVTGFIFSEIENTEIKLPILMYHHIVEDGKELNLATISESKFVEDMTKIKKAGFNTILYSDVLAYTNDEIDYLPEKPLLITFDDGYTSNYDYAFKVLKELNMKANINIIGWSIGIDEKIIPHFDLDKLLEMKNSGLIEFGSHSFDLHKEKSVMPFRQGVIRKPNESTKDYFNILSNDNNLFKKSIEDTFVPEFFCYPYGDADFLSETILRELKFKATIQIGNKVGTIIKGKPYSLYGLYRINASYDITSENLVEMISEG